MNKIPGNVKNLFLGISTVIFLLLNFGLGPTNLFGLSEFIQELTDYYFAVPIYFLDYALISLIPFFGLVLSFKDDAFKTSDLVINSLKIVFSTTIILGIGLYILTFIGKPTNPLIPQYLISEVFFLYSTILIGVGIYFPFLIPKQDK